jgi:hypothetical protein
MQDEYECFHTYPGYRACPMTFVRQDVGRQPCRHAICGFGYIYPTQEERKPNYWPRRTFNCSFIKAFSTFWRPGAAIRNFDSLFTLDRCRTGYFFLVKARQVKFTRQHRV